MKKSFILVTLFVIILSATPLFAVNYYEKGNTFFSLKAGIISPTLISFPFNENETSHIGIKGTRLNLGGMGSLAYQICILPNFALGGELGYCFNYGIDGTIFTQVPITAKISYIPLQTGKFDVNVNANLGVNFVRYSGYSALTPIAGLSLSPVFYLNDNWGIGIDGGIDFFCKFANDKTKLTLFGETPVTLCVDYRR